MDVLTAHTPAGFLHAVTCDWPEGMHHGVRFQQTQERQGCTVRRYAMDEYLALRATAHVTPTVSPRAEAVPARVAEVSGRDPDPLPEMRPPWEAEAAGLPAIGATIVHPVLGYAVVSHVLQQGGQAVAVARGPRGEALVRGAWQVATDVDVPRWLRPPMPVAEAVRAPVPVAVAALVEVPSRPRARAAGRELMPSLWGDV